MENRTPEEESATPLPQGSFNHVEHWIFDLDNTLYPPACDLFSQVDRRMCDFIMNYLKLDEDEARRVQKHYYVEHGTTLSGLMSVHGMKPGDFLDYVHDIDVSGVPANLLLGEAIARLPGRKVIFTNGSLAHAENVAKQLGIDHHFDAMFDIATTRYEPKPRRAAYERFIEASNVEPARAAMFEDIARNLVVPHELGMTTVWVKPPHPDENAPRHQKLSAEGAGDGHVHHVTEDLTVFLERLLAEKA
ncbi:pyrimidine 5'-nucleotidase [Parvibaculum sp.]|uniref:pyrimidine 5'-nucleotidase n=1 Tax=Parvibaculum sp. TaxID=2024848 RepID=UPI000C909AF3|nr:pyrimidine 5'-nucleotidase [Parvibaculum sp.]MAB13901.1 pyrimidine 5'-nucleotidase [Parvibaculum sp.]